MMHEKIGPHHLERKAILYVRQSSAHQVGTIAKAAPFNTPCAIGWQRLDGHTLRL
ncbi:hypothetical protein M728_005512 (plasmid) [Ensifer sp. WSM1721]|nr:hypothetical protein [Ensifer sp. WSM1721]